MKAEIQKSEDLSVMYEYDPKVLDDVVAYQQKKELNDYNKYQ